MVKNSNFRKIFLPVDSVDPEDSESLAYKNFSEFWKNFSRSLYIWNWESSYPWPYWLIYSWTISMVATTLLSSHHHFVSSDLNISFVYSAYFKLFILNFLPWFWSSAKSNVTNENHFKIFILAQWSAKNSFSVFSQKESY